MFHGLGKLKLQDNFSDAAQAKDHMAFWLFGRMGIDVLRTRSKAFIGELEWTLGQIREILKKSERAARPEKLRESLDDGKPQ